MPDYFNSNKISSIIFNKPTYSSVKSEKKSVQFNEEVTVQTVAAPAEALEVIDEARIDQVLGLIQVSFQCGKLAPICIKGAF